MQFKQKRIEEFANEVKGKKNIYCFGAGIALTRFLNNFQKYRLEEEIKCVVDNCQEKQGTIVQGVNSKIPIISIIQMLKDIESEDVILVTTVHFLEIIEQLNRFDKLKDTECYFYNALIIEQSDYDRLNIAVPEKLSIYHEQKIPKIIHYCWFGGKPIPDQYKVWMKSWKKYCPDYEIIEWNEKNYDVKKTSFVRQAYEKGKWAFVSDYARMDIVDEYGGVYLDTDVELIKNIDEMLMNDAFCGFESNQYVAYGLGFGAIKRHPVINEIKEYYNHVCFELKDGTLNHISCPVLQTEVMKKYGLVCNGEFQIVGGMAVYPSRVLCGMSPLSFRVQRDLEYTYAIHHYTGSWLENVKWKKYMISCMKKISGEDRYYFYL